MAKPTGETVNDAVKLIHESLMAVGKVEGMKLAEAILYKIADEQAAMGMNREAQLTRNLALKMAVEAAKLSIGNSVGARPNLVKGASMLMEVAEYLDKEGAE